MATKIRAQISEKNKYYIDKHRHYELKHFCLQYPLWKKAYVDCPDDEVFMIYYDRIQLLERVAKDADNYLWRYILKAVTEGLSYTYLRTKLDIPCGKDMYYDRYRRFFWLLSEYRN